MTSPNKALEPTRRSARLAESPWTRAERGFLSHVSSHRAHRTFETRSLTLAHAW